MGDAMYVGRLGFLRGGCDPKVGFADEVEAVFTDTYEG